MVRAGLGLNHPELVRRLTSASAAAFQWTRDYLGVAYLDRVDQFGGHSVPRCYTPVGVSGSLLIKRQAEKLKELGGKILIETRFEGFVRSADGTISGVRARPWSRVGTIRSRRRRDILRGTKGIVLATGGFGADIAFRKAQDPRLDEGIDTTNVPFATAEALVEALRIGASPVQLSHIQLGPWASPDEKGYGVGPRFGDYVAFQYGLVVSPLTSARIVNELGDRKMVADAILAVGAPCIGIADSQCGAAHPDGLSTSASEGAS